MSLKKGSIILVLVSITSMLMTVARKEAFENAETEETDENEDNDFKQTLYESLASDSLSSSKSNLC